VETRLRPAIHNSGMPMSKPKRSMPIQLVVPEKSPEDLLDTHLAGSDYENFISVLINSVVNAQYLNSSD
jgi:hypothetical protein